MDIHITSPFASSSGLPNQLTGGIRLDGALAEHVNRQINTPVNEEVCGVGYASDTRDLGAGLPVELQHSRMETALVINVSCGNEE